MNYLEALAFLKSLEKKGINLGLMRIEKLLAKMGNPQDSLRFVHIAGTNGKGSTSTLLANMLICSGYKVGLFTSPTVLTYRERIQLNNKPIQKESLAECTSFVQEIVANIKDANEIPTLFEVETAIAFEFFKREKCSIVCLEVGLGGKLDSTNIIKPPLLQIITSISLDHTNLLGNTIEEIATEKAGIIKGAKTIVYPLMNNLALKVLKNKCIETKSVLIKPSINDLEIINDDFFNFTFKYKNETYKKALLGKFQIYNCLTAITAAKELTKLDFKITPLAIKKAIETTTLPARTELISRNPLIILDGAHNIEGAKALEQTLLNFKKQEITLIIGILKDKNYEQILKHLAPHATKIITVTPNNPRALSAEDLKKVAKKDCSNVLSSSSFEQTIAKEFERLNNNNKNNTKVLIVCGSLYLAADIRPLLLKKVQANS